MTRPPRTRVERGILIVAVGNAAAVNDGQSDLYRRELHDALDDAPESRPRVALDLGGIDFLSSSGVALLIGIRRRVERLGGSLAIYNVHPYALDLLRMMKLLPLFRVADDEASALAALGPESPE